MLLKKKKLPMLGKARKLKFLCFAIFALFPEFGARTRPQDLWPFLISETGLKFLILITQGKIHPGNRASPVNRAHMKRPLPRSRELSQHALSYEHIENLTNDLGVRRDLGNRAHMKRPLISLLYNGMFYLTAYIKILQYFSIYVCYN